MLSAFATELGAVIGDLAVPPDQNEITAAVVLLKGLPSMARSSPATRSSPSARFAGICATETVIICSSSKTISPNSSAISPSPSRRRRAFSTTATFPPSDGPPPILRSAQTLDKGHGRIETRRIAVSSEVVPHLGWPGLAQVAKLTRTRRIGETESADVAYLITSLSATEAAPERLLERARAHRAGGASSTRRAIENKLHYVRFVTFLEEDAVSAPAHDPWPQSAISLSPSSALAALHVPEARENFREDRALAITAVTGAVL